jgi:uncharacterized membrane protein YcaP (DUF421 family)
MFLGVDWSEVFQPRMPLAEIFVRGSLTYLLLFVGIRVLFKRETGDIKISRLLVIVLVADAIQNGMAGGYTTLTDGLLLVAVIIGWSYTLDWLGMRFIGIQRFLHPDALLLIKDGRMIRENMREEMITRKELMEEIRLQGLEEVRQVRRMWIEGDGRFSVLPYESKDKNNNEESQESIHSGA